MNHALRFQIFGLLSLLAASLAGAQTPAATGSIAALQAKRKAFGDSLPAFAAQDYSQGEGILEAANLQSSGTPRWQVESGFELEQVAFALRGQSDAATVAAVTQLALSHLRQADQTLAAVAGAAEVANEKEIAGCLYLYLLGDRETALQYFQAAVALSPKTGHAGELLALVRREKAAEARKLLGSN